MLMLVKTVDDYVGEQVWHVVVNVLTQHGVLK